VYNWRKEHTYNINLGMVTNHFLLLHINLGEECDQTAGTPCYMAPEAFMGIYGKEVDIWSADVILYTILSGGPPFSGGIKTMTYCFLL
jgi:serine/threonine protein kinase